MKGAHEKKKRKATFADVVITVCVVVALAVTGCVVWEYHRLREVMPSGVISALFGFWGGELLIIALRQVFGSDVIRGREPTVKDNDSADKDYVEADFETADIENNDIFGGSI